MNYARLIERLTARGSYRIRPGLEKIRALLGTIQNPQNGVPVIHIAGTNGKGSVAASLESVLRKAGYRTGMYISPHLIEVNERIQINGQPISRSDFAEIARRLMETELESKTLLTYFEFTTAMAYMAFVQARCDVAIVECGMGGRWDATNVVDSPVLSIITSIGLDHTAWLGITEKAIALEKAGIIKNGRPVVSGVRGDGAGVIRSMAKRRKAPLLQLDRDFSATERSALWSENRQLLRYQEKGISEDFIFGLIGNHQIDNAAVVIAAVHQLRELGWNVGDSELRAGLRDVFWPGRFQLVHQKGVSVLLDGAHNPAAMKGLRQTLLNSTYKDRSLHLLFGAYRDKDVKAMASLMGPLASSIHLASLPGERGLKHQELKPLFKKVAKSLRTYTTPEKALVGARRKAGQKGLVLVTGSLALVGSILKTLSSGKGDKHHV